jgi:hypothetical protein
MTGGNINNAETSMTKPNAAVNENAFIVRTAMSDDIAHTLDYRNLNVAP